MRVVCLLPARNAAADLPGWLASAARVADAAVALDDGSTDGTRELLEASPLVEIVLANPRRETYHGWHDGENRNRLLDAAAELKPDWIVSLDADDRVPADEARALRGFLATDALPGLAYGFQYYRMWGDDTYDPRCTWVYRLFAYEPGLAFPDKAFHFNPVPTGIPHRAWVKTSIRVQHLGSSTEERRLLRLEKYREAGDVESDFAGLDARPEGKLPRWQPRPAGRHVLVVPGSRP